MNAWLEDNRGGRFPINGSCAIGRLPGSSVTLADRQVSRRHALVIAHFTGEHWLVDFGSSNGTRLNGIAINEPRRLKNGDVIEILSHKLLFNARPTPARSAKTATWEETEKKFPGFHSVAQGVLVLGADGAVQAASPHAREWLATYFRKSAAQQTMLPDELNRWLQQQVKRNATEGSIVRIGDPFLLMRAEKRLRIQLADAGGGQFALLFNEEDLSITRSRLERLGLTKRESQVMLWLAEGKTNGEIGAILKTSPRTVEKQVASILQKLNVENRATAIIRAMELAGA
jgi:DNA-binding NarL/FixJ family response regulator